MIDFGAEKSSQHYRGAFAGFGPVRESEVIYLAIFDNMPRNGNQLSEQSFDQKNLKVGKLSVARGAYVTRRVFETEVVGRGIPTKGPFVGVSTAPVSKIRAIRADVKTSQNVVIKVRGFCIIDLVENGDFCAHAVFGYGKQSDAISQKNISKLRMTLLLDLRWVFSHITQLDALHWPSRSKVFFDRLTAMVRACLAR